MADEFVINAVRSGYALFVMAGLVFLVTFGRRLWFDGKIDRITMIFGTLLWLWVANSIHRVGWFVFSRRFPTEGFTVRGEGQNEFLWENKWLMAQETGWFALFVGLAIAHHLKPFTIKEFLLTLGVVFAGVVYLTV